MNRIQVNYTPRKGNVTSCLRIYNDIKGYSHEAMGCNFYDRDADIMLEIMKNVDYSKIKDCMGYGIYISGHEYEEYYKIKKLTKLSDEEMDDFYQRLDELNLYGFEYIELYNKYKKKGKDTSTILEDYETKDIGD